MARKFVRNITGTKCKGSVKEPLATNVQNDILSDEEDVFIRNKKEYHCLTDNLKTHLLGTDNAYVSVRKTSKNGTNISGINATQRDAEKGLDVETIMNPLRVKQAIDKQVPSLVDTTISKMKAHQVAHNLEFHYNGSDSLKLVGSIYSFNIGLTFRINLFLGDNNFRVFLNTDMDSRSKDINETIPSDYMGYIINGNGNGLCVNLINESHNVVYSEMITIPIIEV